MQTTCHICGNDGATIPDPCCNAPDCNARNDYAHYGCLSYSRQAEEDRWAEEDAENFEELYNDKYGYGPY